MQYNGRSRELRAAFFIIFIPIIASLAVQYWVKFESKLGMSLNLVCAMERRELVCIMIANLNVWVGDGHGQAINCEGGDIS